MAKRHVKTGKGLMYATLEKKLLVRNLALSNLIFGSKLLFQNLSIKSNGTCYIIYFSIFLKVMEEKVTFSPNQ